MVPRHLHLDGLRESAAGHGPNGTLRLLLPGGRLCRIPAHHGPPGPCSLHLPVTGPSSPHICPSSITTACLSPWTVVKNPHQALWSQGTPAMSLPPVHTLDSLDGLAPVTPQRPTDGLHVHLELGEAGLLQDGIVINVLAGGGHEEVMHCKDRVWGPSPSGLVPAALPCTSTRLPCRPGLFHLTHTQLSRAPIPEAPGGLPWGLTCPESAKCRGTGHRVWHACAISLSLSS